MLPLDTLLRGALHVITEEELAARLASGKKLRVKLGVDPSSPDLHLGHLVVIRKLRQFQELGHEVVLIIGDFTAMIGDPSGRNATRPMLSEAEVEKNAATYRDQVLPFLIPERTTFRRNSEWLSKLTAKDVTALAAKYTVARMLEREDFKTRYHAEHPIFLHEFLYPLYQAYDSVAIASDIEMGGDDQLFNLHVGRDIMRDSALTPQIIFTMQILEGTDGKMKMSKSYGNAIALRDPPEEVFGKIMSLPDTLIFKYFTLLTDLPLPEIRRMEAACTNGDLNPRDAKRQLAGEMVALLHTKEAAAAAQAHFDRVFIQKEAPEEIETITIQQKTKIVDILVAHKLAPSNAEAKRLIRGNGVTLNGSPVTDVNALLSPGTPYLMKVGKRRFLAINPLHCTNPSCGEIYYEFPEGAERKCKKCGGPLEFMSASADS